MYQAISVKDINDILELIEKDESIYIRVKNITFSFVEFIKAYGWLQVFTSIKRIGSGYGMAMYELGIFGVFLIVSILKSIYYGCPKKYAMIIANTLTFVMFSAIQLLLPILPFLIGFRCYRHDKENLEDELYIKTV